MKKIPKPGYHLTHAGNCILSCVYSNNEGVIYCVDKKTYQIVKELKSSSRILAVTATKEQVWIACQDKAIRVWDIKSMQKVAEFDSIHEDKINHLCFVPNENNGEVWSSSDDKAVHVWNAKTRELEERLIGIHGHCVKGATYMGNRVWTYTMDATVYTWNREVCYIFKI